MSVQSQGLSNRESRMILTPQSKLSPRRSLWVNHNNFICRENWQNDRYQFEEYTKGEFIPGYDEGIITDFSRKVCDASHKMVYSQFIVKEKGRSENFSQSYQLIKKKNLLQFNDNKTAVFMFHFNDENLHWDETTSDNQEQICNNYSTIDTFKFIEENLESHCSILAFLILFLQQCSNLPYDQRIVILVDDKLGFNITNSQSLKIKTKCIIKPINLLYQYLHHTLNSIRIHACLTNIGVYMEVNNKTDRTKYILNYCQVELSKIILTINLLFNPWVLDQFQNSPIYYIWNSHCMDSYHFLKSFPFGVDCLSYNENDPHGFATSNIYYYFEEGVK